MSHYFQASSNRSSLNEQYVFINFGTTQEDNPEGISQHGIKLIDKTNMTSKLLIHAKIWIYTPNAVLVVVFFQDNNMPWSQIYFPEATSKDGVERNKLSGKNVFDNGNRLLTIVKQEPDGNIELLQKHHKIDLPISRQSYKRFNKRRSTIDVPDARILYLPRYKRKLSHPTTSIFKSRRYWVSFLIISCMDHYISYS